MTEAELVEKLADKEHESWARWMGYVFTSCATINEDRSVTIPVELVGRWWRQINTPYADLSEPEKQSDRDEVAHILPIVAEYAVSHLAEYVAKLVGKVADGGLEASTAQHYGMSITVGNTTFVRDSARWRIYEHGVEVEK